MLGTNYDSQNCSIARALESIGERWTLLVVRELFLEPRRFLEIERRLSISKNVLTSRLEKLALLDIVEKIPYKEERDWNTYQLTKKGLDLFPVMSALMAWGDVYEAPFGAPAIVQHKCGQPAGHKLVCQDCGDVISAQSVKFTAGPGLKCSKVKKPRTCSR